jgi:uncharacterized membrane protein YcfT
MSIGSCFVISQRELFDIVSGHLVFKMHLKRLFTDICSLFMLVSNTFHVPILRSHVGTLVHRAAGIGRYSNWLWAGRPRDWNLNLDRGKTFLFSTSSRPVLRPTQSPIKWVPAALSPGVKRQGREADHSPPIRVHSVVLN